MMVLKQFWGFLLLLMGVVLSFLGGMSVGMSVGGFGFGGPRADVFVYRMKIESDPECIGFTIQFSGGYLGLVLVGGAPRPRGLQAAPRRAPRRQICLAAPAVRFESCTCGVRQASAGAWASRLYQHVA